MSTKIFIWDLSASVKYGSRTKLRTLIPHYCEICGHTITPPTKHRIKPGKNGGRYIPGNVIGVCPNCHNEADRGMISEAVLFNIVFKRLQRDALMKQCWACEKTKSLKEFADQPEAEDGKHSECRNCMGDFKLAKFMDDLTKLCSVCLKPKPLEDFSPYPFSKDQHRPECAACRSSILQSTSEITKGLNG